jgi:hypothetical protein
MKIHKPLFTLMAIMSLAGTTLFLSTAVAGPYDKSSSPAQAAQAAMPAQEIVKFMSYTGTFDGDATVTMNGKSTPFKLRHVNTQVAQGFGLQCNESADIPEMGHYEASNIFGFETGKNLLHLYTVSNMGDTHDHWGKWSDDKTWDVTYEGLQNGKKLVEKIHCVFDTPTSYHFTSETTVGGQFFSKFAATMTKVN